MERVPGPGSFVVKVVPGEAIDTQQVRFSAYGDRTVLFASHRGEDRFLTGVDLPSTLRAHVDGRDCEGSIDLVTDIEADATLTIDDDGCELRLDLRHPTGAVDHHLDDDEPIAS